MLVGLDHLKVQEIAYSTVMRKSEDFEKNNDPSTTTTQAKEIISLCKNIVRQLLVNSCYSRHIAFDHSMTLMGIYGRLSSDETMKALGFDSIEKDVFIFYNIFANAILKYKGKSYSVKVTVRKVVACTGRVLKWFRQVELKQGKEFGYIIQFSRLSTYGNYNQFHNKRGCFITCKFSDGDTIAAVEIGWPNCTVIHNDNLPERTVESFLDFCETHGSEFEAALTFIEGGLHI